MRQRKILYLAETRFFFLLITKVCSSSNKSNDPGTGYQDLPSHRKRVISSDAVTYKQVIFKPKDGRPNRVGTLSQVWGPDHM